MKKSIFVLFAAALTLAACLSPSGGAPQATVTPEATVTLALEPTLTPQPTESPEPALPAEVVLTEKEQQIYSTAPETYSTPEGDLPKSWSEKYAMPVYTNKDGEIVAIWLADKRDVTKGNQQVATTIDGVLTTIDDGGREKSIYPAVATVEIEANEFSGIKIFTKGEKFRENPTLSQEQLPQMRDYLIALYNDKQLRQFEIGERGAMQLGPSFDGVPDFVMNPANTALVNENGNQPMYLVQDNERKTFRWDNPETRPILVAFPYSEGGVIFAQLILDRDQKIDVMGWSWMYQEWLDLFSSDEGLVQSIVNYESNSTENSKNAILVPTDVADATKYIKYLKKYLPVPLNVEEFLESMEQTRSQRRNLYQKMVREGKVPQSISNGEYISILSRINATK